MTKQTSFDSMLLQFLGEPGTTLYPRPILLFLPPALPLGYLESTATLYWKYCKALNIEMRGHNFVFVNT